MTTLLLWCSSMFDVVPTLFVRVAYALIKTCLVVSFFHYVGWIRRAVWLWIEHDFSKVLNDTPVTLGSLEFDLLRGNAVATNVVVHQPGREEWKWSSPLLARAGRVYVEFDIWGILRAFLLVGELPGQSQTSGMDLYTIEVSDVQAFIERRSHVFNFYLCDSSLDLPDPQEMMREHESSNSTRNPPTEDERDETQQEQEQDMDNNGDDSNDSSQEDDDSITEETKQHAEQIVNNMFSAVNKLSRAAQRGSLKGALMKQRRKFTSKLKELKDNKKKVNAIVEGSRVIRHVSNAVVKKTHEVGVLPPVPKKRESTKEVPPLYVRIGRIHLKDMRIFTQDNWELDNNNRDQSSGDTWNKPIVIDEVTIRSAELCPPMSLLDNTSATNLPAIYQPIDRLLDVILKRVLAEIAKTNTGRLFKTAMGEVLSIMKSSGGKQAKRNSSILSEDDGSILSG